MRRTRGIAVAARVVALMVALAACGSDAGTSASRPSTTADAGSVAPSSSSPGSDGSSPGGTLVNPPSSRSATVPPSGLGVPRTYDDALAHFDALGAEPVSLRRFVSPSGNIYCVLRVRHVRSACEISVGGVTDAAACPAPDQTDVVGRLEFHHGRATAVCNTDTIRTPGARVLPYGSAVRFRQRNIQCLSEQLGVTCINLTKTEGFFLHRGEYVIFNAG